MLTLLNARRLNNVWGKISHIYYYHWRVISKVNSYLTISYSLHSYNLFHITIHYRSDGNVMGGGGAHDFGCTVRFRIVPLFALSSLCTQISL
jgi:hypothetical protein